MGTYYNLYCVEVVVVVFLCGGRINIIIICTVQVEIYTDMRDEMK